VLQRREPEEAAKDPGVHALQESDWVSLRKKPEGQ
jgi:hypothetical protein